MLGYNLPQSDYETWKKSSLYIAKVPVFPFSKFPGTKEVKGPEMKSTGEVMGIGLSSKEAFAKAMIALGKDESKENKDYYKTLSSSLFANKMLAIQKIYCLQSCFKFPSIYRNKTNH